MTAIDVVVWSVWTFTAVALQNVDDLTSSAAASSTPLQSFRDLTRISTISHVDLTLTDAIWPAHTQSIRDNGHAHAGVCGESAAVTSNLERSLLILRSKLSPAFVPTSRPR